MAFSRAVRDSRRERARARSGSDWESTPMNEGCDEVSESKFYCQSHLLKLGVLFSVKWASTIQGVWLCSGYTIMGVISFHTPTFSPDIGQHSWDYIRGTQRRNYLRQTDHCRPTPRGRINQQQRWAAVQLRRTPHASEAGLDGVWPPWWPQSSTMGLSAVVPAGMLGE